MNRITPDHIQSVIKDVAFLRPEGTQLTICVLTLANGFTVTGESACADPANFDAMIGERIARENAEEKIWALEGYLLKQRMHDAAQEEAEAERAGKRIVNVEAIDFGMSHRVTFADGSTATLDAAKIASLNGVTDQALLARLREAARKP